MLRMFGFAAVFGFVGKHLGFIELVGKFCHRVLFGRIIYFVHIFTFFHGFPLIIRQLGIY